MRRFLCLVCLLVCLLPLCAGGEDGSFIVVEDDEAAPDARRQARALMKGMTEEEKVYQLFFVAPEDLTGESYTLQMPENNAFLRCPVGGVVLFGQNIASEAQLKALTDALQAQARAAGAYPLFIGVHEAGGSVSRVANKLGYPMAAGPEEIGRTGDESAARAAGEAIAAYLAPLGINLDFAPPADTAVTEESGVRERAYGADAEEVSRLAAAMAEGLRTGGLIPCFGHFPNDGSLNKRNYYGMSSNRRTLQEMREAEFLPFAAAVAAGAEMMMMSNGVVRAVGDDMPASLSHQMIDGVLRQELGYDGVVITEALNMPAVTSFYRPGQAAVMALQAGADLLLLPQDLDAAAQAVFRALETGELTWQRLDLSVERILAIKIRSGLIR